jgi:hypothetical protein
MKVTAAEMEELYLRAVASEMMREIMRVQLQSMSTATLAQVIGVSVRRLNAFMNGGTPGYKLWNAGEAFADGMKERPMEVDVEAVAVNVLLSLFDDIDRPRVRRALGEAITPILREEGWEPANL